MSVSMKQLKKALAEMSSQPKPGVSGSNTGPSKAAKKKNKRRKAARATAAMGVPGTASFRSMASIRQTEFHFSHREFLGQVVIPAQKTDVSSTLFLSPFAFPWLGSLSKNFERYQWLKLALHYIPDVGTTKSGSIAVGVDWGATNPTVEGEPGPLGRCGLRLKKDHTRAQVLGLTPSLVTPLWKPATMIIPTNMLQSRKWYEAPTAAATSSNAVDLGPGFLVYFASAESAMTVGDVWADYSICFGGTRA